MSQRDFNHLLSSLSVLSREQLVTLRRELDSQIAAPRPVESRRSQQPIEETVFDVLERSGLIGCLEGSPGGPTDLSTNPKHMEGFGRG
jgi:hypothetical protein